MLLRVGLGLLTLIVALATGIAGLLIVLPPYAGAPGWLASVILTEWSLLLVLPGITALLLAWFSRWAGLRKTAITAMILACIGVLLSTLPAFRGALEMSAHEVRFDPLDYVSGPATNESRRSAETQTYTTVGGVPLNLDVWTPHDFSAVRKKSRPAVLYVHGGNWVEGERSEYPRWDTWFTDQGYVVFDIDYRLAASGRPTWREAPGDVKCALAWAQTNAQRYGVDPERLVMMGESAGGQLAMLASYTSDSELPSTCPGTSATPKPAAVVAMYAPTVLAGGYNTARPWWHDPSLWETGQESMRTYLGGTPDSAPDAYLRSEPFRYVTKDSPPTLLVHGGKDMIVPAADSRRMASALAAAGVPHDLVEIGYADHNFDLNFGGFAAQIARAEVKRFLSASVGRGAG